MNNYEQLYNWLNKEYGDLCEEMGRLKVKLQLAEARLSKARKEYYQATGEYDLSWPELTKPELFMIYDNKDPFIVEVDKVDEISIDEDYLSQLMSKKTPNSQHNGKRK